MEKILVSACLLGEKTRYDGESNEESLLSRVREAYDLVPFCPEVEGGLPIPRPKAEIRKGNVYREDGTNVTSFYLSGAEKAVKLCRLLSIRIAILKESSPACGVHEIHDGRFKGNKIPGMGLMAEALKREGIRLLSEKDLPAFIEELEKKEQAKAERKAKAIAKEQPKVEEKPLPKKPFRPKARKTQGRPGPSRSRKPGYGKGFKKPYKAKKKDGR